MTPEEPLVREHSGPELARDAGGHPVIDCVSCGFAHFWPKPTPEELSKYYAEAFYETHSPPDWAEKELAEEPYWEIEHQDRLETFTELVDPGRKPRATGAAGRLLDIGCGGGWLIAYAARRGWDVLGIEPSRHMWEKAVRRAPVLLGTLEDVEVDVRGRGPFDAVHLKLVMEHVAEPLAFLHTVRDLLRPGGAICIEVPNDFNPLQAAVGARLGKDPWWMVYPVHINYFSFDSLERLLARSGFTPARREATYPMEWFLLQGIDYLGKDEVGRQCHGQRMQLERHLEEGGLRPVRRSFMRWLASQGIGREAIVYATRKD